MEPQSWVWGRYTFLILSLSLQDCHLPQHLSFSEFGGDWNQRYFLSEFGEATFGEPGTELQWAPGDATGKLSSSLGKRKGCGKQAWWIRTLFPVPAAPNSLFQLLFLFLGLVADRLPPALAGLLHF